MRDGSESEEEASGSFGEASDASDYDYEDNSSDGMMDHDTHDGAGPSTSAGPGWSVLNQGGAPGQLRLLGSYELASGQ